MKEGSNRCRFSCIICIIGNLLCYVSNIYLRIAIYRCMLLAVHMYCDSRKKKLFFSIWDPSKNVSCLLKGGGVWFFSNIECRWKQKLASKNKNEECVGFCFNIFFFQRSDAVNRSPIRFSPQEMARIPPPSLEIEVISGTGLFARGRLPPEAAVERGVLFLAVV